LLGRIPEERTRIVEAGESIEDQGRWMKTGRGRVNLTRADQQGGSTWRYTGRFHGGRGKKSRREGSCDELVIAHRSTRSKAGPKKSAAMRVGGGEKGKDRTGKVSQGFTSDRVQERRESSVKPKRKFAFRRAGTSLALRRRRRV